MTTKPDAVPLTYGPVEYDLLTLCLRLCLEPANSHGEETRKVLEHYRPAWEAAVAGVSFDKALALAVSEIPHSRDVLAVLRRELQLDENGDNVCGADPLPGWETGYCAGLRTAYRTLKNAAELPQATDGPAGLSRPSTEHAAAVERVRQAFPNGVTERGRGCEPAAAAPFQVLGGAPGVTTVYSVSKGVHAEFVKRLRECRRSFGLSDGVMEILEHGQNLGAIADALRWAQPVENATPKGDSDAKDAARYRWLRSWSRVGHWKVAQWDQAQGQYFDTSQESAMDIAIDNAMLNAGDEREDGK